MKFKSPTLAITAIAAAMLAAPVNPASAAPLTAGTMLSSATAGIAPAARVTKVHSRKNYRKRRHNRWRGHRGSRRWRPGYRRHSSGWWFPLAAFGALAAGAAAANAGDLPPAHYRWCDDRYRSYDYETNTFQPYNGPRRRCNSPYDGY